MYNIVFAIYIAIFKLVSIFHKKAEKMVHGHKQTWQDLKNLDSSKRWIWFHASSLGEFEQALPVMEKIKKFHSEYSIILTFYSPSGYEVKKNYKGADLVCYLPFDTRRNTKKFIRLVNPEKAFFIKYEFWPNYLKNLYEKEIPTYLISGIFRKSQLFFKPYGQFYRNLLKYFTHFFVQNEESVKLLASLGHKNNVTISGDTRFDRVCKIAEESKLLPIIEDFVKCKKDDEKILVMGSSWQGDEQLFIPLFNENEKIKLIIAPHEIGEDRLRYIESLLKRKSVRYSQAKEETIENFDCIIIDCFGILSSIYKFADAANIGGGFGVGIHNTLEAAVYGMPLAFGPNYHKFYEAKKLIKAGAAFPIKDEKDAQKFISNILYDKQFLTNTSTISKNFVKKGSGSSNMIFELINW